MTSQPVPSGTFMILTPSGISIPQLEQPGPSSAPNSNLKKGLKEESKALGTIQILTGLMILSVGITLACVYDATYFKPSCSKIVKSSYPFIGGVLFIISGSLSVASERKKTKSLTQISLAANVISGIGATAGLILFSVVLSELREDLAQCIHQVLNAHQLSDEERQDEDHYTGYLPYHPPPTYWACDLVGSTLTGTLSVMLIFTGLELVIAVFSAFFDWRRLSMDSNGRILFLPHGRNINSSLRTALYDPAYEELGAST
ncbi:membrane-spanning 4-domains subfamily A member 6A-like [Trichosurus vulpecula]|uniref:membrane-spanning 4-domains subfamily A member 6A-like n=1 Tax=Trichosurus vulpecula TaxID=9337 RepID=UPI00186B0C7F|nr:membrane-spanning 4-domains subfamily A member 6A-like [Trichosurus vulpecula]